MRKPSWLIALSPTNGNVIVTNSPTCKGVVIIITPLMVQSRDDPIISFLTFEEPSPHFCGDDGAGAV